MNIKITPYHFEQLLKDGFTLDMIFLLKLIEEEFDIKTLAEGGPKTDILCQTLRRKGLVSEQFKITVLGKNLLEFMNTRAKTSKIVKKTQTFAEFERWWAAFPGTDIFTHKGKSFSGARTLRVYKDECQVKLDIILAEGEYTIDQLIAALEYEVSQKKETSVSTGTNRLTYMQGSLTYLNQRSFQNYIELINQGFVIKESAEPIKGMDI
tara:strand:- start:22 stop:648 length:627 start_codon:yes stop_codon:yes gene_type:complete